MIKTKYNFKQWLCRTYPDVIATPIYGLPAYILSKPLKPLHMHEYMIQQLANGQYIVFIGLNATQIERYIRNLNEEGIPHRRNGRQSICCPTTFSAFERWLARNNIRYNERVYVSNQTASEVLHIESEEPGWNTHHNWYLYDVNIPEDQINPLVPRNDRFFLIKAPSTLYVSKRSKLIQNLVLMEPVYEQLVRACTTEDWERAQALVDQYASIQFDFEAHIKDINKLKEAFDAGTLYVFVRNVENFEMASPDETL